MEWSSQPVNKYITACIDTLILN